MLNVDITLNIIIFNYYVSLCPKEQKEQQSTTCQTVTSISRFILYDTEKTSRNKAKNETHDTRAKKKKPDPEQGKTDYKRPPN